MIDKNEKVESPIIGELYNVVYIPDLERKTGFLNRDGVHIAYSANAGQIYFRRVKDDGARGNLGYENPCVESFQLLKTEIVDSQKETFNNDCDFGGEHMNREFSKIFGKL